MEETFHEAWEKQTYLAKGDPAEWWLINYKFCGKAMVRRNFAPLASVRVEVCIVPNKW